MSKQEQVLLYQFRDEEKLALTEKTLHKLGVKTRVLPDNAYHEKVGYLLGSKGFRAATAHEDDGFVFPHEVMVLQNIRNKRLEQVLDALRGAGVEHIRFKAVVTPLNTLWTLRRLCETMQREHAAMQAMESRKKEDMEFLDENR